MADVELVIKIPIEYYNAIAEIPNHQCTADMIIIKNGKPLPKGHGRLIDADALYEQYSYADCNFDMTMEYAATIIEADKENE